MVSPRPCRTSDKGTPPTVTHYVRTQGSLGPGLRRRGRDPRPSEVPFPDKEISGPLGSNWEDDPSRCHKGDSYGRRVQRVISSPDPVRTEVSTLVGPVSTVVVNPVQPLPIPIGGRRPDRVGIPSSLLLPRRLLPSSFSSFSFHSGPFKRVLSENDIPPP